MTELFVHTQVVNFDEGDPAGIAFFANAYVYAHRAYEAFMRSNGLWDLFKAEGVLAPFVHTECDHLAPMRPGDTLRVSVRTEKLGNTSLTLLYEICGDSGITHARIRMVSVFVDSKTFEKIPVPEHIRQALA